MKAFGLIGHPITHSFSKVFFEDKFKTEQIENYSYTLFDLPSITDVLHLKLNPDLIGLNVTIPYKQSILPYLDSVSDEAMAIGAVNTIKINNGTWHGFNTDSIGFEKSITPLLNANITKALVLGTGGASKAVMYVLEKLGISCSLVSRQTDRADFSYTQLSQSIIHEYLLIVNTTPIGMFPNINEAPPLPYHCLNPSALLYDLIYNPKKTLFLKHASLKGCDTKNGLEMFVQQAEESWKIWNA